MSQQELADAIGVKVANLGNWEADTAKPRNTLEVVGAIAAATDVSVVWLAGLSAPDGMDSRRELDGPGHAFVTAA